MAAGAYANLGWVGGGTSYGMPPNTYPNCNGRVLPYNQPLISVRIRILEAPYVQSGGIALGLRRISDNALIWSCPLDSDVDYYFNADELAMCNVSYNNLRMDVISTSCDEGLGGCQSDDDCPEGYRCVDGDCVECEEIQATHFYARFEFPGLCSTSNQELVTYLLSPINAIGAGVTDMYLVPDTDVATEEYQVRIVFCDENGVVAPYNGLFSVVSQAAPPPSEIGLGVFNGGEVLAGWALGPWVEGNPVGDGYKAPQCEVQVDTSAVVWEEDCGGPSVGEVPLPEGEGPISPIPPIPEPEPVEPDPIDPIIPIIPPIPPGPPVPPVPPETGCECEIYIGGMIGTVVGAINNLWDYLRELVEYSITSFQQFVEYLVDNVWLIVGYQVEVFFVGLQAIYDLVIYLVSAYQYEQRANRELMEGLFISDSGKSIANIAEEFVDNYEPVAIENEFRTQSHRVIDHLDSTILDKI